MKNVLIGLVVGAAVIAAFFFGFQTGDESDGPVEQLGEGIDDAAGELNDAAEDASDAAQGSTN